MGTVGVTLVQDEIRGALSQADELARSSGADLVARHQSWVGIVSSLRDQDCPRTYLPVLAVLLTARSLRSSEQLNVLHIQQQTSSVGYAAASIGRLIIPFAVEQGIDLLSRSSQIMNNQPFTYKARIEANMSKPSKAGHFRVFYEAAERVNALDPTVAVEVLACLFHESRISESPRSQPLSVDAGKVELKEIVRTTAEFVISNSENGKVGQAFAASVLDVVYGEDRVILGNTADPDASVPGDVQVTLGSEIWLWVEAKQKSVTTGDVETFINKVRSAGGGRIIYCAFANERYPHNIDRIKIERISDSHGMALSLFISPADMLGQLLDLAPGTFGAVASRLVNSMLTRLEESGCSRTLIDGYGDLIRPLLSVD